MVKSGFEKVAEDEQEEGLLVDYGGSYMPAVQKVGGGDDEMNINYASNDIEVYDVEVGVTELHQPVRVYHWYSVGHTEKNRLLARVLGTCSLQMLLAFAIGLPLYMTASVRQFLQENWYFQLIFWIAAVVVLVPLFLLHRKAPWNGMLLAAFTALMSVSVASTVAFFDASVVIEAIAITFLLVAVLFSYVLFARVDFRPLIGFGIILCSTLLWWSLFTWLIMPWWGFDYYIWTQVYALIGIVLFSLYILWDLTMISRGDLCERDWVIASAKLWLDIVNLFLYVLLFISGSRR
jgi:FtsH-binding integral membrane protein